MTNIGVKASAVVSMVVRTGWKTPAVPSTAASRGTVPSSLVPEDVDPTHVVEIWKKTIDVHQHFNNIEMRIRNIAITVLAALLGVVGFALKEKFVVTVGDCCGIARFGPR